MPVMRDHKISLFQAHEEDLVAEVSERDSLIADMEAALEEANTSLAHQRAERDKLSRLLETKSKRDSPVKSSHLQREIDSFQDEAASPQKELARSKKMQAQIKEDAEAELRKAKRDREKAASIDESLSESEAVQKGPAKKPTSVVKQQVPRKESKHEITTKPKPRQVCCGAKASA